MPELPEVETVRCGLAPVMEGEKFSDVLCRRPDLRFPFSPKFAERLRGARVTALTRRAKYLLAHLSTGETLLMHLGMSGRFLIQLADNLEARQIGTYEQEIGSPEKHAHVVFTMSNGAQVTYSDPRRFGYMLLLNADEIASHRMMKGLGIEPLGNELTADYVAARAFGRTTDLKAFLMDQRHIAGLGNIYVCEALFRARLRPTRKAAVLTKSRGGPTAACERLVGAIRDVLREAIDAGGSTLRDYRQANGAAGAFQSTFYVYGREGEPCHNTGCGRAIRRTSQAGRSTFYCPSCQR